MLKRLFKLTVSLTVFIGDCLRQRIQRLLGRLPKGSCVVLYYHSVKEGEKELFAKQLDAILRAGESISAIAPNMFLDGQRYVAITFDDAMTSFRDNGLPEILKRHLPVVVFVPIGFVGREVGWAMEEEDTSSKGDRVLSLNELREMAKNPLIRFGSHTVSHAILPRLTGDQTFRELADSKRFLEMALSCTVDSISFPYGACGNRELQLAARAGYSLFFTTCPSPLRGEIGSGVIGRVRVDPSDWPLEFKLKLAGAYRWQRYSQLLRAWIRATGRRASGQADQSSELMGRPTL